MPSAFNSGPEGPPFTTLAPIQFWPAFCIVKVLATVAIVISNLQGRTPSLKMYCTLVSYNKIKCLVKTRTLHFKVCYLNFEKNITIDLLSDSQPVGFRFSVSPAVGIHEPEKS